MRPIWLLLPILLTACAPAVLPLSEEELYSSSNLVWVAGVDEALAVTSSAIQTFNPAVGVIRVRAAGSIYNPDGVREFDNTWLEQQNISVLALLLDNKVALAVLKRDSYSPNLEEGSVADRLRKVLMTAMDERFRRGQP